MKRKIAKILYLVIFTIILCSCGTYTEKISNKNTNEISSVKTTHRQKTSSLYRKIVNIEAEIPITIIGKHDGKSLSLIKKELSLLPENMTENFQKYKWTLFLTNEDLGQTELNGDYLNVYGITRIPENYIKIHNTEDAICAGLLHEMGHFLDYCKEDFPSESNIFYEIFLTEYSFAKEMGMEYGTASPSEYFAEAFYWYLKYPEKTEQYIPETYQYIKKCIENF